jgi:uncharacterized repeat protein (TIGR03803 family)
MKGICTGLFGAVVAGALVPQFSAAQAQTEEKVLYSFCGKAGCADGADPNSSILIDVNGTLYGPTFDGGTHSLGTVFALNLKTGAEKVLHSFCSVKHCADGEYPVANLIDVPSAVSGKRGILYGTTNAGGGADNEQGTLFAIDPNTRTETVLHRFCGGVDGCGPGGGLTEEKGMLYGTTGAGGAHVFGTVFSFDPKTGSERMLYSFCSQQYCPDGAYPESVLIDVKDALYGTTAYGGANRKGTVFAFDPNTGVQKVLYSFCSQQGCTDGASAYTSLVDVNGTLYGTTLEGGTFDGGTAYALDPATGAETVLYSFCSQQNCTDGLAPESGLVEVNGTLYGTTTSGGAYGGGEVFALDPNTGAQTVVYSFCTQQNCPDGHAPNGNLIAVNGTLYGATYYGGANGRGTVFELTNL